MADEAPEAGTQWHPPYMKWFEQDFCGGPDVRMMMPQPRLMYCRLLLTSWHSQRPPYLLNQEADLAFMADAPEGLVFKTTRGIQPIPLLAFLVALLVALGFEHSCGLVQKRAELTMAGIPRQEGILLSRANLCAILRDFESAASASSAIPANLKDRLAHGRCAPKLANALSYLRG